MIVETVCITTPPNCIGIMGGGQLGRMIAIASKQMGYKVAILDPDAYAPAKIFADYHIIANYQDQNALDQLAHLSSVITTEFENVPAQSMAYLYPKAAPKYTAIAIAQDRHMEKNFFNSCNIPTVEYCVINNEDEIATIANSNFPAILKTNTLGYDGKGQIRVNNRQELLNAFYQVNKVKCILEKAVNIKQELSIMIARNNHEISYYPITHNIHRNGILHLTLAPAQIELKIREQIIQMANTIINKLNYIGILGIEFFLTEDDRILANEMAPRPHNSGHYTIDACITSQFEQQVRAICNLKLGSTYQHSKAIMINLLGNIWQTRTDHPNWQLVLNKYNNIKLHLYDKIEASSPSRKMGHITILGEDTNCLNQQADEICQLLGF